MIEKLRRRFFRISLIAMAVAMITVTVAINLTNAVDVRNELRETLNMLAENEARGGRGRMGPGEFGRTKHQQNLLNQSAFFSGFWGEDGPSERMNLAHAELLSDEEAAEMLRTAGEGNADSGWIGDYLYVRNILPDGRTQIVFLNGETRLSDMRRLMIFSAVSCLAGILLAAFAVNWFSRKAMEPILKNEEQQKQFITDASHELRTPLTVISANMDVLDLDLPENTWVRSTQKQVSHMRHLVDELVYLSRLEENSQELEMRELDLTALMREVAEPFAAMAEFQGKEMDLELAEGLKARGNEDSLRRMLSTLCDNAVKYASEGGRILISAGTAGKQTLLRFANDVDQPLTQDQCQQLFRRFYRADASRSKEKKSGFGIGLSIAAAIAEKHGGSIRAMMEEGRLVIEIRL